MRGEQMQSRALDRDEQDFVEHTLACLNMVAASSATHASSIARFQRATIERYLMAGKNEAALAYAKLHTLVVMGDEESACVALDAAIDGYFDDDSDDDAFEGNLAMLVVPGVGVPLSFNPIAN